MANKKEYKLLEERTVNKMVDDLNTHGAEGWEVVLYVQEFGVTKVIICRDAS